MKREEKLAQDIGDVIRFAGERETVADDRMEEARAAVAAHWATVVEDERQRKRRSARPRYAGLVIAATVLVAVAASWVSQQPDGTSVGTGFASVARYVGRVQVAGAPIDVRDAISVGDVVETDAGSFAALRMGSGHSLRIDENSVVIARSENVFRLDRGAVYVDSAASNAEGVFVETRYGVATDIGTQFEVRLQADNLKISVREGRVELAAIDAPTESVRSGQALVLSGDGATSRLEIRATDPMWAWAQSIAPGFEIGGALLVDYIDWYARERGLAVRWMPDGARDRAREIELDGSIAGLSLDEGLVVVSKIAAFEYELTERTLTIRLD